MPRRSLLSSNARETLFGIPTRLDELVQHYLLSSADLELIRTRRRAENQFGLAVHLALLRHPGQGWQDGVALPIVFLGWLGDQLRLSPESISGYADRGATRTAHQMLAMQHLDLVPFASSHFELAEDIATKAAFATDHGLKIVETLIEELRRHRLVLPSADTIERLALRA